MKIGDSRKFLNVSRGAPGASFKKWAAARASPFLDYGNGDGVILNREGEWQCKTTSHPKSPMPGQKCTVWVVRIENKPLVALAPKAEAAYSRAGIVYADPEAIPWVRLRILDLALARHEPYAGRRVRESQYQWDKMEVGDWRDVPGQYAPLKAYIRAALLPRKLFWLFSIQKIRPPAGDPRPTWHRATRISRVA